MAVDPERPKKLPVVDESPRTYEHPLYHYVEQTPGLSLALGTVDQLLTWGLANSLWIFPMATSCCGIEFMAAAASRVDLDRMGTIVRASPRHSDVMVVAGTITVKMAPRVKKLWDQMPEPKWCIAMGSCAISGDFYRNLYPVIPGVDTMVPVDVYVPGCPPNPEGVMHGLLRLQEKVRLVRSGKFPKPDIRPALLQATDPCLARMSDPKRDAGLSDAQSEHALHVTTRPLELPSAATPPVDLPPVEATPAPTGDDLEPLLRAHGATDIPKDAPALIPLNRLVGLAQALQKLGYKQLVYIAASHWPAGKGRAGAVEGEPEHHEVAYALRKIGPGSTVASWSVTAPVDTPVPSLTGVLAGADWQEREQFDLVGVRFAGHPDLRRIMMPEDWIGHPLRKDYAADTHTAPWR